MSTQVKTTWVWVLCLVVAAMAGGSAWLLCAGFQVQESAFLYVDADDNVDSVSQKLKPFSPRPAMAFSIYAKLMNLDQTLRTGRYEITPTTTQLKLAHHLRNHVQQPVRLIVPAVRTIDNMATSLAAQLMVDSASLHDYLTAPETLQSLDYTIETLPTLFIPNTYEVYWDTSVETLVTRLQKERQAFWNEIRMAKIPHVSEYVGTFMTPETVMTLASIVDSETANNTEKPIIAGLYMNRLRKGMLLQSDPTVIFALQDFSIRRVRGEHLKVESPYNTYRYKGLPPGPIRVPSIAGIDAVLNFAAHDYLYMCAKEDFSGTHNFAANYAEHQRNAARYTKALNARNIH